MTLADRTESSTGYGREAIMKEGKASMTVDATVKPRE